MQVPSRLRACARSFAFCLIAMSLVTASITLPAFSKTSIAQRSLITQQIDEGSLVTLTGNTCPEGKNATYDRGPVADTFNVDHMLLVLQRSPAQERRVEKLHRLAQRPAFV
jgi:hypothetical protein